MSQEMQQRVTRPVIAGATGGTGASVLAAAIGGVDHGVHKGSDRVHLLVCRPWMTSLYAAEAVLGRYARAQAGLGQHVHPPVLAVVADLPRQAVSRAARARLRLMEPNTSGIVHVPFVAKLRETDYVDDLVAQCRDNPPPRELGDFTQAMKKIIVAVVPLLVSAPAPAPVDPAPYYAAPYHAAPMHLAPFHAAPMHPAPFHAAAMHPHPPLSPPAAPVPVAYPPAPAR
jgi:hypothetical protein